MSNTEKITAYVSETNIIKQPAVTKFHKVSFEQFKKDLLNNYYNVDELDEPVDDTEIKEFYDNITLPTRATIGSAGYDFVSPVPFELIPGDTIVIPTGIRAEIAPGWMLQCFPRSGHGFKYRIQLDNTVGIIDSDYFYSDNEGHIMIKLTNDSKKSDKTKIFRVNSGDKIVQGVFTMYGVTVDDNTTGIRNGGFGSTTKSENTKENSSDTKELEENIKYDSNLELDELINSKDFIDRVFIADHGYGLDKLVNDKHWLVRKAVAEQGYGLDKLVNDKDWRVRQAVAEQGYGLGKLIEDKSYPVRSTAISNLNL